MPAPPSDRDPATDDAPASLNVFRFAGTLAGDPMDRGKDGNGPLAYARVSVPVCDLLGTDAGYIRVDIACPGAMAARLLAMVKGQPIHAEGRLIAPLPWLSPADSATGEVTLHATTRLVATLIADPLARPAKLQTPQPSQLPASTTPPPASPLDEDDNDAIAI